VAPWIHLGRLKLRFVWFFTTPIHIVSLWMTSVVAGILGVMLTILLFRQPATVHADTVKPAFEPLQAFAPQPEVNEIQPLASFSTWEAPQHGLQTQLVSTRLNPQWTLNSQSTVRSEPLAGRVQRQTSVPQIQDGWTMANLFNTRRAAPDIRPYSLTAALWSPDNSWRFVASSDEPAVFGGASSGHPGVLVSRETPAAQANGSLTYSIILRNIGGESLDDVAVTENVSDMERVELADPPAQVSQNALHWSLSRFAPGEERRLTVTVRPRPGVEFVGNAEVRTTVAISAATSVVAAPVEPEPVISIPETPVSQKEPRAFPLPQEPSRIEPASNEFRPPVRTFAGAPLLSVEADFPTSLCSGDELSSTFIIRNTGTADAKDIVLRVHVPPQLEHHDGKLVEHRLSTLRAGETRRATFRAIARTEGAADFDARLIYEDDDAATWSAKVKIVPKTAVKTAQKPTLLVDR
jgi:hypothetical protein